MRHAAGGGGSHRDAYFLTLSTLFTASLNAFPAVNFTVFAAAILISSPVLGLRPVRAAREPVLKLPNPTSCTVSPLTSDFVMISSNASTCSLVIDFGCPVLAAIASPSSCLFMFLGLEREDCFPVVFPTANRISGPAQADATRTCRLRSKRHMTIPHGDSRSESDASMSVRI